MWWLAACWCLLQVCCVRAFGYKGLVSSSHLKKKAAKMLEQAVVKAKKVGR